MPVTNNPNAEVAVYTGSGTVLAAWLLLLSATTLLATGVIYGDAVASGGLHRSILAAPPATRITW